MDSLVAMKSEKKEKEISKYRRERTANEKRQLQIEKVLNKLYEDRALERISDERYHAMSDTYEVELRVLKSRSCELFTEIEKADEVFQNAENFIQLIRQYTDVKELNAKILNELIDRIIVHEKTINEEGSKSQRVDIYYKFIGYFSLGELIKAMPIVLQSELSEQKMA